MKKKKISKISVKEKVKKKYQNKCYICGQPATTVHHIIPKALGGKDEEWNLVPLCENCQKKIHKLIDPLVHLILATQK